MFTSSLLPECVVMMTQVSNNNVFVFPLCPPHLVYAIQEEKKKTLVCELLEQAGRYPHCRHCTVLPESKKLEGKK